MLSSLLQIPQTYAADLGPAIVGAGKFQDAVTVANPCTPFGNLMSSIITSITVFASLAFVLYFILGALKWITAGGDKNQVTASKDSMTQATIGLIAVVVSYFIIGIVGAVLGLKIYSPFATLFDSGCSPTNGQNNSGNYTEQYTLPNGQKVR